MRQGILEILSGIIVISSGVFLLWEASTMQYAAEGFETGVGTDPRFYPRILLYCWVALGCILFIRGFFQGKEIAGPQNWALLGGFALLSALYFWIVTLLGFFFSSIPLCVLGCFFLGYRRFFPVFIISILFPLFIWYLFVHILGIPLPASPWFYEI